MKLQAMELPPFGKANTVLKKTPKLALLIMFSTALILFTIIPLCYPLIGSYPLHFLQSYNSKPPTSSSSSSSPNDRDDNIIKESFKFVERNEIEGGHCDIFSGEWVPNPEAPYYTNNTCWAIHEHQNCMKYGRGDTEFMKWRWKPQGCDLPIFNPLHFLDIVRDKSMAFVGDSVGRNHMQSLICLLSRVEYPIDISDTPDEQFKRWKYLSYNFTLATFWTPHLVKAHEVESNGPIQTGFFNLYLDEFDLRWTSHIHSFDYLILNSGYWFFRPSVYYEQRHVVGCWFCHLDNVTDLPMFYGYRRALRTAFRAINSMENYNGITFLRTFAPSHFENGEWNKGGDCVRKRPFRGNETKLEGGNLEFYMVQLEEFKNGEREGKKKGLRYRLLDTTEAMLLRPDGHPSRYGHWPHENVTLYNDCVHWCLPGPIDTWNDFLLEMLKIEAVTSYEEKLLSSDRKMKFT